MENAAASEEVCMSYGEREEAERKREKIPRDSSALYRRNWVVYFPPIDGQSFFLEGYDKHTDAEQDAKERQVLLNRLGLRGKFRAVAGFVKE